LNNPSSPLHMAVDTPRKVSMITSGDLSGKPAFLTAAGVKDHVFMTFVIRLPFIV